MCIYELKRESVGVMSCHLLIDDPMVEVMIYSFTFRGRGGLNIFILDELKRSHIPSIVTVNLPILSVLMKISTRVLNIHNTKCTQCFFSGQ